MHAAGLEELDLYDNAFTRLPPALAAATQMRRLDMRRITRNTMKLTLHDVDRILLRMGQLRHLDLNWNCVSPAVTVHLFRRMPQLVPPEQWILSLLLSLFLSSCLAHPSMSASSLPDLRACLCMC